LSRGKTSDNCPADLIRKRWNLVAAPFWRLTATVVFLRHRRSGSRRIRGKPGVIIASSPFTDATDILQILVYLNVDLSKFLKVCQINSLGYGRFTATEFSICKAKPRPLC